MTTTRPGVSAMYGMLCAIPLLVANAIVANRIEPFFTMIRPGPHTSAREYVLLVVVISLLAVGAFIAARPMFLNRRFYVANGFSTAILALAFVAIAVALGTEIYRCDILGISNCD